MSFRMGLLIGGLAVAAVALAVAVVVMATGGESERPSAAVIAAHNEACPVTESGDPAELDLSASGLDCAQGRAVQTAYERVASMGKAAGAIEVMGWSCTSVPFSDYPTLTRCRSQDGRRLDVLGMAPSAHLSPGAAHPPDPTAAESGGGENSLRPVIFQTPSENIGCRMETTRVVCDIFKFDWSPPPAPASCEQPSAWGHTIIFRTTGSTFSCADGAQVNPGPRTPILHYGKAVVEGPFACESRETALICVAPESRHGILLSVGKLKLF